MLFGGRRANSEEFMLHCRGSVRLFRGVRECTPKSRKGRALLALLAAERRPLARVRIIDLLWSNRQEEQARASLRTLLADLKAQHGDDFRRLLTVERERVELGAAVRCDLDRPERMSGGGELFEDLDHLDPELDDWLRAERERRKAGPEPQGMTDAVRAMSPLPRFKEGHFGGAAILLLMILSAAFAWMRA